LARDPPAAFGLAVRGRATGDGSHVHLVAIHAAPTRSTPRVGRTRNDSRHGRPQSWTGRATVTRARRRSRRKAAAAFTADAAVRLRARLLWSILSATTQRCPPTCTPSTTCAADGPAPRHRVQPPRSRIPPRHWWMWAVGEDVGVLSGSTCIALLACPASRFDRSGWSESGARIVPQLRSTDLNRREQPRRDLRIRCLRWSNGLLRLPWGSRGRRFKSCRPDGRMGGGRLSRPPPIPMSTCGNVAPDRS
jgi:hypothetical protein